MRSSTHGLRSLLRWTGVLLIGSGLALFGWVGWQLYGTSWLSQRDQAAAVEQVQQQWRSDGRPTVTVDGGRVEAVVRIPRFGDDYAVPLLQGTSDDALATGFGHLTGTARPGERGNFAVAAHRVTHGEPLRDMPQLQADDEVVVVTEDWTYTYRMLTAGGGLTVGFEDTWVLDPVPDNPDDSGVEPTQRPGQRLLTLTTCAELFHTDNRLVAFGLLTDRERTEV